MNVRGDDTDDRYDEGYADARRTDRAGRAGASSADFGGIRWGSAFFGWLTAVGLAVILTAVLAAIGTAVGVSQHASVQELTNQASTNVPTVGIAGGVALVGCYCEDEARCHRRELRRLLEEHGAEVR